MVFSPVTLTDDLNRSRLAVDATKSVAGSPHGARSPLTRISVLETHVFDCPWCGDHNRVVILTSHGTVSRCLRCRDEDHPTCGLHVSPLCGKCEAISQSLAFQLPIKQSARTQTTSKEVPDAQGERVSH